MPYTPRPGTAPVPNRPGKTNWVEKGGGLPPYIRRIAEHLVGQGMSVSHAIATAKNTVERWAAGGTVTAHGGPKVSAKTQAAAAKALAQWRATLARGTSLSVALAWSPEDHPRGVDGRFVSHPVLFHTTRAGAAIKREGFHGKPRSDEDGGEGAYFGAGTYFHTKKSDSDRWTAEAREADWGDEEQIPASAHLTKVFHVRVKPEERNDPEGAMHRSLVEAGIVKPDEEWHEISSEEMTRRLMARGYDGVQVYQDHYSNSIAGDQLVVFNPKSAAYGHRRSMKRSGIRERVDMAVRTEGDVLTAIAGVASRPAERRGPLLTALVAQAREAGIPSSQVVDLAKSWDESQHPRDSEGKFTDSMGRFQSVATNQAGKITGVGRISRNEAARVMFGDKEAERRIAKSAGRKALNPNHKADDGPKLFKSKPDSGYDFTVKVGAERIGHIKRRSGSSIIGEPGRATSAKNTGFNAYTATGTRIPGSFKTRKEAFEYLARLHGRNLGP